MLTTVVAGPPTTALLAHFGDPTRSCNMGLWVLMERPPSPAYGLIQRQLTTDIFVDFNE